ncbi:N-acetylmuramoyl-L-alanine amidase, partial [Citricoccus sp. NPDC079358]|uniref:N-acetylmuramoyl-L-alanine amidase n=1 Tax=Citricoccus sp. NPDC079358 TaxID=3154653 RepID=UPI00344C3C55
MSRTLHPVLKAGAATALALTLTATTVLPATAMPVVPDTAAAPAVTTATSESAVDPAVESGEVASEVKGDEEQSIALGGIDPEALPEVADTPESTPAPDATEAPDTPGLESTETPDGTQTPDSTPAPSVTDTPDLAEPSATSAPEASEAAAAESEAAEPEVSLMSSTLSALSTPVSGTPSQATGSESQPSDVVIRDLRAKADGNAAATDTAADAPVAPEAEELTDTVFNGAISSTQEVEVERIATLTQPVETMDFIVAGVTWDIAEVDQVTDVSLRVREAGEWTDWNSMEIHDGDEAPHADRVGTEPLISSGGDAIQVRVTTADGEVPAGLELELIDPGTAETDGKLEAASSASEDLAEIEQQAGLASQESAQSAQGSAAEPAASLGAGQATTFAPAIHEQQGLITGTAQATATANTNASADAIKPKIITRAQWGADESKVKDWGTPSTDLQAMYVHHTAGSNNYTESGAYAQIRGIYSYHARSLAWGDIGYQFLVDKYGNIFQGRRGSIEKPVQGAQAGGFNSDTIGISAMGNYDVASAPAPMVRAIEKVLAWQAYRYDVDPTANVTLTQRGKGTARWSDGTRVTVPTILGHKVTNSTACPGRYLDAQLPTIRKNVDRLVAAAKSQYGEPQLPGFVTPLTKVWENGRLTVTWRAGANVDRYRIMRRVAPAGTTNYGPWKQTATYGGQNTRGRFDVAEGTTTQWGLRTENAHGLTGTKTIATWTRKENRAPGFVTPLTKVWENGRLTVTWRAGANVDRYRIM